MSDYYETDEQETDILSSTVVELDIEVPVAAQVRSDLVKKAQTAKGAGFAVDFHTIYQVHGAFDRGDVDNASLVVIRIVPLPRHWEKQFLEFSVNIEVRKEEKRGLYQLQTGSGYEDPDESNTPHFVSLEPASQGEQFVDIYTTNETRERATQANAQITAQSAAVIGGQRTWTDKSEFKRTHLLKVRNSTGNYDTALPSSIFTQSTWILHAAVKEQGIGDSFTVALLVKRPLGTKFELKATVDGDLGSFRADTKRFLTEGLLGRKKDPVSLGLFGPAPGPADLYRQKIPKGVLVEDLHHASTDNVMRDIEEVGLHLPESSRPVKFNPAAKSATSLELDPPKPLETTAKPESNLTKGENTVGAKDIELGPSSSDTPRRSSIAQTHRQTTSGEDGLAKGVSQATNSLSETLPPSSAAARAGLPVPDDLLPAILQQLQLLADSGARKVSRNTPRSEEGASMVRVRRHRKMAALYEQLAELHREEAKEYLPPHEQVYLQEAGGGVGDW